MSRRIPLRAAWHMADAVVKAMTPYCEQIQIVGSIRRATKDVGDIDIVCLPKPGLKDGIKERAGYRTTVISDGDQVMIVEMDNGVQVDLWIARSDEQDLLGTTPGNWGTLLLCRTGSMRHNILIAQRARARHMHWQPHEGLQGPKGERIASHTEEAIYHALGLRWIPPAFREQEFMDSRWDLECEDGWQTRPRSDPRETRWIEERRARLAAIDRTALERFDAMLAKVGKRRDAPQAQVAEEVAA